ncbi:MAG: hypothetical protein ACUVQH_04115, partial [Thermogutta sp.]
MGLCSFYLVFSWLVTTDKSDGCGLVVFAQQPQAELLTKFVSGFKLVLSSPFPAGSVLSRRRSEP